MREPGQSRIFALQFLAVASINQFGFKQSLGTDTCIYVLKEIVDKYRSLNGGLYMCFLDASKAFDRVKHSVLFDKLVQRGVPGYIVRILCYWYAQQTMCVIWGSSISSSFRVSNGVTQGGILSPHLFNVYVDDLSQILNRCRTGCLSGNITINHYRTTGRCSGPAHYDVSIR